MLKRSFLRLRSPLSQQRSEPAREPHLAHAHGSGRGRAKDDAAAVSAASFIALSQNGSGTRSRSGDLFTPSLVSKKIVCTPFAGDRMREQSPVAEPPRIRSGEHCWISGWGKVYSDPGSPLVLRDRDQSNDERAPGQASEPARTRYRKHRPLSSHLSNRTAGPVKRLDLVKMNSSTMGRGCKAGNRINM